MTVLVVSGCIAGRGKSTLSWTVHDLNRSNEIYREDCESLGIIPNEVRPTIKKLPFKCSENDCDKSFGEQHRLKNHLKEVHKGIRKTFLCNHCGKGLCSNQQLKRHENKFHKGEIIGSHTMSEVDKK